MLYQTFKYFIHINIIVKNRWRWLLVPASVAAVLVIIAAVMGTAVTVSATLYTKCTSASATIQFCAYSNNAYQRDVYIRKPYSTYKFSLDQSFIPAHVRYTPYIGPQSFNVPISPIGALSLNAPDPLAVSNTITPGPLLSGYTYWFDCEGGWCEVYENIGGTWNFLFTINIGGAGGGRLILSLILIT